MQQDSATHGLGEDTGFATLLMNEGGRSDVAAFGGGGLVTGAVADGAVAGPPGCDDGMRERAARAAAGSASARSE